MFTLRMVWRELRAAWGRLLFFFLCVAIGVGAIAALRSVIQNVRAALVGQARVLTAADVVFSTNRPWPADVRAKVDAAIRKAPVRQSVEVVEFATMVRPSDESKPIARMAELQAVDSGYPLYGTFVLRGGQRFTQALLDDQGVLVRPELLVQLGIAVGDKVRIGESTFTIRGVIESEPGRRAGMFSLGPRVIIARRDLEGTGLLSFGSRARFAILLRVDEAGIEPLVEGVRAQFKGSFVSARSYRSTEDRLGEDLRVAENYLSLIGFVMVVLGGIGVWSVTRVFIGQRVRSIAVMKCLGATSRQILGIYIAQVATLGLLGSLLGLVLGAVALRFLPGGIFGLDRLDARLTPQASAQAVAIGVLVSLLFALVPLLEVRRVRPLWLLRDESARTSLGGRLRRIDWVQWATVVIVGIALALVASWQAASLKAGAIVSIGLLGITAALFGTSALVVRAVRPLRRTRVFALRHAVLSLARPGNQTRVILLAVGLGAFFILGVRLVQATLLDQFSVDLRPDAPDMFLLDVQRDQAADVERVIKATPGAAGLRLIPVLRARVTGVRGTTEKVDGIEGVQGRQGLGREFVITYRARLEANETLVDGAMWATPAEGMAEVSIEESLRRNAGLQMGDIVRFDVLGRVIEAKVTSVRDVDWNDMRTGGFMFVFRPGVLEKAPHGFMGVLRAPDSPEARARLQRDLVDAHSNVSAVDVREVVKAAQGILGNVTLAITAVGGLALFSGILIVIGSVAMTRFQRLYESAILKTLGATPRTVMAMVAMEYLGLGALGGLVGAAGALVLSWALSRYLFEMPWHPAPLTLVLGVVLTSAVVGAVGVLASLDVVRRRPLAVLRAE
ncbi:outer membrane-specific lipoprotein transporter subunit LolC [Luteitalea pratensis]|uniref:Outer membrane-specific lipoprotein transporter subunit LolC n=1 Tax=Luteitalea pratensis TaxID=1855912 RepID=A0A143PR07_LUTPR|nr:FtsX-like permease family protein [Luteitalea pratensis]AMY11035.1 outer membrane-specific lipoprotein transporter subunit LolC [Luteitalea pratensis]